MTKTVDESIPPEEIDEMIDTIADAYGVDEEDVDVAVVYKTTGTIDITIDGDVPIDELQSALEDEIADILGIHESMIEVSIVDGVVHYTITSDTAEEAQSIQDIMDTSETLDDLDIGISATYPQVTVSSVTPDEDVVADIVVTVDTTGAENNLEDAADKIEDSMQDMGYDASAESNISPLTYE